MPYPIYSVRFLNGAGAGATKLYTVPAGYVAVVVTFSAVNLVATAGSALLAIAGIQLRNFSLPGALSTGDWSTRQVARSGEQIAVTTTGSDVRYAVSGYLLQGSGSQILGDVHYGEVGPPMQEPALEKPAA